MKKLNTTAIAGLSALALLVSAGAVATIIKKRKDEVEANVPCKPTEMRDSTLNPDLSDAQTHQGGLTENSYELKVMWPVSPITSMSRSQLTSIAYNCAVVRNSKDKETKAAAFQELTKSLIGAKLLGAPYTAADGSRLTEQGAETYVVGLATAIVETGMDAQRFGLQAVMTYSLSKHAFDVGNPIPVIEG